tara:strand:- start:15787 stop:16629 length:843 start_codon:yes stop_codon:yes gene_type:complete
MMECRDINDLGGYGARYDYTAYLSRRDWAYEHIRRIPAFEATAWRACNTGLVSQPACHQITLLKMQRPEPEAEAWGLKFFPNPSVAAPKAHVFWTDDAHGEKVHLKVSERMPGEVDRIFEQTVVKCQILHLTDWEGFEHLVIQGKGCSIQARCTGLSLTSTDPVKMSFDVDAVDDIGKFTRILEQSKRVYGDQITSPPIFTRKAKLMRNGLIALDGNRAGLSDRQIAWIIEGRDQVESGVAKGDRSLIKRVKTYRDNADALCNGGFRALLVPRLSMALSA